MALARKNRITLKTLLLPALYFCIPICSLHKAHRNSTPHVPGNVPEISNDIGGPALIRLYGNPETLKAVQRFVPINPLKNVQRDLEPVRLFGVDSNANAKSGRLLRQLKKLRYKLAHDAIMLRIFVTGIQRRQFYRDAGR